MGALTKRRRIIWIGFTIVFIGSALLITWTAWRVSLNRALDRKVRSIAEEGHPVTLQELASRYPIPPDDLNGAPALETILAKMVSSVGTNTLAKAYARGSKKAFTAEQLMMARPLVATNREVLDSLPGVLSKPQFAFNIAYQDGFAAKLPHLGSLREAAQLLHLRAKLQLAEGDCDGAVSTAEVVGRLSNTLTNEPILVSRLVCVALNRLHLEILRDILASGMPTEAQLASMSRRVRVDYDGAAFRNALAGEICFGRDVYQSLRLGQLRRLTTPAAESEGEEATPDLPVGAGWFLRLLDFHDRDELAYVEGIHLLFEQSRLPTQEQLAKQNEIEDFNQSTKDGFKLLAGMLLPALSKIPSRELTCVAESRVVATAVAIERFRRNHNGRLPSDLRELDDLLSSEAKTDPFTGRPLVYRAEPQGYLIYSVGDDGIDHKGAEMPESGNKSSFRGKTDIVFRRQVSSSDR